MKCGWKCQGSSTNNKIENINQTSQWRIVGQCLWRYGVWHFQFNFVWMTRSLSTSPTRLLIWKNIKGKKMNSVYSEYIFRLRFEFFKSNIHILTSSSFSYWVIYFFVLKIIQVYLKIIIYKHNSFFHFLALTKHKCKQL